MNKLNLEQIGELADKIDNLLCSLQLRMPPQFHVEQMKQELKIISCELKTIYISAGGIDVWHEDDE